MCNHSQKRECTEDRRSKGTFAEGEPRSGAQAGARRRRWPHVTRRRTMLFFREFSCDFRVPSRCRDPKMRRRAKLGGKIAEGNGEAARKGPRETLRLRSAKVDAPTSSPIKANLKANCDDLQAEPQAQRFSRKATRQRGEFSCIGRRPGSQSIH